MRAVVDAFGPLPAVLQDQWLFTVLCAVMDGDRALVFGVGDGAWSADGVGRVLDAGPENAPPYLAYRLCAEKGTGCFAAQPRPVAQQSSLSPQVHFFGAARQLVIATDGLTDLAIDEPALWKNPFALERKLRVRGGHDDTTVAILKRAA